MKLTISFKHLEHTPALDERIREKSDKLEKYFQGSTSAHWVCWVDNKQQHWAEIQFHGPKFDFFAKASADNMYKALDLAVDKIERQIDRKHELRRNKLHNNPYESPKYQEIKRALADEEETREKEYEEKSA